MRQTIAKVRRGGDSHANPNVPWTMTLPDGRTLVVEIPGQWTTTDPDGSLALLPPAVRFLDRVQVLATEHPLTPSPGYIRTLRQALGLTQSQLADRLAVSKMTVARWEWGAWHPTPASIAALRDLRRQAITRGVLLEPEPS